MLLKDWDTLSKTVDDSFNLNSQRTEEAVRRMWLVTDCQLKQGAQKLRGDMPHQLKCAGDECQTFRSYMCIGLNN